MFLFLLTIILLAYFIEYPEYLLCKVNIISENHTKKIIARETGEVTLFVSDFERVNKGQNLGIINSSSNNLVKIKPSLDSLTNNNNLIFDENFIVDKGFNLGEVELFFLDFLKSRNDFFMLKNIRNKQNNLFELKNSLDLRDGLINNVKREKEIMLKKLELEEDNFKRQKVLYEKGVISKQAFNESKDKFYTYENSVQDILSNISRSYIDRQQISSDIKTLNHEMLMDSIKIVNNLLGSFKRLNAEVKKWDYFYNFRSPSKGQFFFSTYWSNGQTINAGDELGSVIPEDIGNIFCEGYIETHNSGKIKKGQEVKIYLDSYSFEEFGLISGVVENVSKVPKQDNEGKYFYKINIDLKNGLTTSLGHKINYTPNLNGEAKIVTKDLNLLERLFYKLKRLEEKSI
ncbi:MAG: HlyD family efflux transporter periplasmic adaptor subunit [Ignavibacteriae bacterium]|nr:HlyD family efflux transporter periplasmic adaptor subunit [Ignavibacteriota bacterium]